MKRSISIAILTSFIANLAFAQVSLDYYLPKETTLNPTIPTPQSIIGHEVGEWHISHDRLVQYMYTLAETSDRIQIEEYGRTYENRPLVILKISSPENIQNLEAIREEHIRISDFNQSENLNLSTMPLVYYLGYSIHGNEASGSNAALLVAYYLAAAQSDEVNKLLENSVILLDPSYNPDGLNRFASWVNSKKSMHIVSDPNNIEQNEPWPKARTNHYWFDLNRDWLPVQHPESQGRVKQFHLWKPNVLTDHHEMGTNKTFFFQPGIPSRNNPLTPNKTYALTEKIAQFHAEALDEIGSLYYSKESYDDFYIGKGSSYPDINGAVGILFEQASARSHAQQSINGLLTFPFAIRNHFTTSLSTLMAGYQLKDQLLEHQREFYSEIKSLADEDGIKAYVFNSTNDYSKLKAFLSILESHQIEVFELNEDLSQFKSANSYIIPFKQNQYRLIKGIFEKRTDFQDSLFYDVSAWTLPLAFDLNYQAVQSKSYSESQIGQKVKISELAGSNKAFDQSSYGYVFSWEDSQAPALLYKIQQLGLRVKTSTEPWITKAGQSFNRGAIFIPIQDQTLSSEEIYRSIKVLGNKFQIQITSLKSGNTTAFKLGSPTFQSLTIPKPILVIGKGVNAYEAGEVWHLLDQRVGIALPMISIEKLNSINLNIYNTLILVDGNYGTIAQANIKTWVQNGGNIITIRSAGKWASEAGLSKIRFKKIAQDSTQKYLPYNQLDRAKGAQRIGGAIFETQIDLTHPLGFGFTDNKIPVFKKGVQFMEIAKNPYAQPAHYTSRPLLAGYISEENLKHIPDSPAIGLSSYGRGLIISLNDNPNFRAYWFGTNRLFLNALFFSDIISSSSSR